MLKVEVERRDDVQPAAVHQVFAEHLGELLADHDGEVRRLDIEAARGRLDDHRLHLGGDGLGRADEAFAQHDV